MQFALLGNDPLALPLIQALARHATHRLVRLVGPRTSWNDSWKLPPTATSVGTWEELLIDQAIDVVVVASQSEQWQPVVRQLVQADKGVIVLPSLAQSIPFFYELALVASEHPGKIFPLLTWRSHPLVVRLLEFLSTDNQKSVRHVQVDCRPVHESTPARVGLMTASDIEKALVMDVDLLRRLFGTYDQVTASRSGSDAAGYSLATVMLAGRSVPQVVWTATAGEGAVANPEWTLTVAAEDRGAVLEGSSERGFSRLTLSMAGESTVIEAAQLDSGMDLLEQMTAPEGGTWWHELARAVELVEAVERSVRRRRAIDVHFETPSERGLFKTQMTAVGCSLLMLTLGAVVLYLVLAATVEMPQLMKKILVGLTFLPLGAFLILQLLVFVARPAARDNR